ncbi:MAG: polysaccharide deacetylase family protein [Eubacteriales bacterium]
MFRKLLIILACIGALCVNAFAVSVENIPTPRGRQLSEWTGVMASTRQIPIVMYHSVAEQEGEINPYVVTPKQLESDLQYLEAEGYTTLSISDLIAFVNGEQLLPAKPILLTFDDGYADNYDNAFPLLKAYNAKATISCVMVHYDTYNPEAMPRFTPEQGLEMIESGLVELQNHTYNLHTNIDHVGVLPADGQDLDEYTAMLEADIDASKELFAELEWPAATTFTYPYGASDELVLEIVKNNGYTVSLVTAAETINVVAVGDWDSLYELSRFDRSANVTTEAYFAMVEQYYG